MSEELVEREEELKELFGDIQSTADGCKKMRGKERIQKIEYCRDRIERCKKAVQAYKVEVRYLELGNNPEYKDKIKGFEKKIEDLCLEIEYLEKDELTGDAKIHTDSMTTDQVIDKAADIQRQDVEILHDMIDKTEQDKQIGVDTLAAMGEQRDQLQNARDHVRKIESEAALASRQLRVFAKRMVTDKIILGVLVIIFLAVLVVIIIVAAKPVTKVVTEKFT